MVKKNLFCFEQLGKTIEAYFNKITISNPNNSMETVVFCLKSSPYIYLIQSFMYMKLEIWLSEFADFLQEWVNKPPAQHLTLLPV